jgi:hypothetical protein
MDGYLLSLNISVLRYNQGKWNWAKYTKYMGLKVNWI